MDERKDGCLWLLHQMPIPLLRRSGRPADWTNLLMVVIVLALGLLNVLFAEKIPVNDGLGMDGRIYAKLVKSLPTFTDNNGRLDSHRGPRWLPAGIVKVGLRLAGQALTNAHIARAFDWLNLFWLLLAAYLWGRIADELGIQAGGKWLGFIGVFITFFALKWVAYYPILTDASAFGVGWLMLWAYLRRRNLILWLLTIVSAFIWPVLPYCGILLLLFRRGEFPERPARFAGHNFLALLAGLGAIAWMIWIYYVEGFSRDGAPVDASAANLSILGIGLWVAATARPLLRAWTAFDLRRLLHQDWLLRLALAVLTIAGVNFLIQTLPVTPTEESVAGFGLRNFVIQGMIRPFIAPLAHILFYGPIVLVAAFVWESAGQYIRREGVGLTLVALAGLVMGVSSESRIVVCFIPFLVPFVVLALQARNLPARFSLWFLGLSLLACKMWVRINVAPLPLEPREARLDFPWQHLNSSVGWWMSTQSYYLQGALVLLAGLFLYFEFFRRPESA